MLDAVPGIQEVDDFIDLRREGIGEGDDLVVLRHLVEEVLSVRPEDMSL